MRAELQNVLKAVTELPSEQLPRLLGELEEIRCTAMARLTTTAPAQQFQPDELLNAAEAARRLGVSRDYLYAITGRSPLHVALEGDCFSPFRGLRNT